MNAPRKPEACKAKYAKQKITIKNKDRISEQNPKGAKEGQHCATSWFAKRSTPANKQTCAKRGRELKREALHKLGVCDAKHIHMTNKTCARERGAKERSTSQTWCLRGEAHSHNKKNVCKGEESRREKHYTNPVIARRRTLNLQIKSVQKWQKPSKTAKSA